MEELQSTEVLEREILEDARKKALRIFKAADDTINSKTEELKIKINESITEIDKKYNIQREQEREKIMSRLPIDKLRSKVDRIENLLNEGIENWYKETEPQRIIDILSSELNKRLDVCKGIRESANIKIYFSGIERENALSVIKKAGFKQEIEEIKSKDAYPAIIIETDNMRIIASIKDKIDYLLGEKREDLVSALVGQNFMEHL